MKRKSGKSMRSCKKCFEYAYIFVGGDVRMCPWNGVVIGNLLENTLEEIWRGEKAEEIRKAFMRENSLAAVSSIAQTVLIKALHWR